MSEESVRLQEELDAANRKLSEAHKMASLGRLSAGIVHEINTPIGSIFSNNEVVMRSLSKVKSMLQEALANNAPPPAKTLDMLDVIAGLTEVDKIACERISGVIRSLKTVARSSQDLRKTDVNELVGHTLKLTNAVFRRRVTFAADLGDLPEIEAYPGLLNQVLLNLLVNGAQAIDGDGTVTVQTRAEGPVIRISITDSGQGIDASNRDKIFQAGFTTKAIGEGTGIGLSLSREIVVDVHGGTINFDSEPGHGATFHVRIPVTQKRENE